MAAPEAITYISPAHEAMKPFAERPAKDEKQEHGAMVGIPADVLNTYKPPLSDDTPNFYVKNKQEKQAFSTCGNTAWTINTKILTLIFFVLCMMYICIKK